MIRYFIFRVLTLLSIPASIALAWIAFVVTLDLRSYRSSLGVPEGRDVWVCGDSQSRDGLDPSIFGRLHNFSTAAAAVDQNLLRLRDLLAANPGRRGYVLIDVTPVQLGFDEREVPLSECGPERVHALLHFYHFGEGSRPIGSVVRLVRDVLIVRKFTEVRKSVFKGRAYMSQLVGCFFSPPTAGFIDHREKCFRDMRGKADAFNANAPFSEDSRLAEVLREEAEEVRRAGMTPVFMSTPVSPAFMAELDSKLVFSLTNGIERLATSCGAPYINCISEDLPVECWHDANHLNASGAKLFTARFMSKFMELESIIRGPQ